MEDNGRNARPEKVAFLAPMPPEIKPLVKRLSLTRRPVAAGTDERDAIYEGRHGEVTVVATVSGIGMAAATRAAHRLLDEGDVDHLIVIGVAGGILEGIAIGDVVIPEVVVDVETRAEHRSTVLGGPAPMGRLMTSDEFIKDVDRLTSFRAEGGHAIDMETSAAAAVCMDRGVTWSVFRGISDDAFDLDIDDEVFLLANQDGTPNKAAIARYVARHPNKVPKLARMGKGLTAATTGAVDAALRSLA